MMVFFNFLIKKNCPEVVKRLVDKAVFPHNKKKFEKIETYVGIFRLTQNLERAVI